MGNHSCDTNTAGLRPIDDKLLETRTITLFSTITAQSVNETIEKLLYLDSNDTSKPICLYLNSPGGEVNSGLGLYDILRYIRSEVKIICCGLCASIATIILLGVKKENRTSLENTRFLIHQPLISGTIYGQCTDIEITAKEVLKTKDKINKMLAQETGKDLSKVENDTDRDYWMTSQEALEYGLISRIVKSAQEV